MAVPVNEMVPSPYRVVARRRETADSVTLALEPAARPIEDPRPGQFTMMYVFGIGEVPVSVSLTTPGLEQTVRAVGAVTEAICASTPGTMLGLRGPFGTTWDVEDARGGDLVFAAGGLGLAPLRPAILAALSDRASYGRITVLVGARTPADLLYAGELAEWRDRGAHVEVTVDHARAGWTGHVGLITTLVDLVDVDPARATAFLCGPEVMMRFTARALTGLGLAADDIRISLERSMKCGIGWCGHCQLGPLLVCRDGPVVPYGRAASLMSVKEL